MKLSTKVKISAAQKNPMICVELQNYIRRARKVTNERILRLPKLKEKTGRASSTIWKDIKSGTLPPPVRLGARSVGWKESEIDAWIAAIEFASRSGQSVDMKAFISALIEPVDNELDDSVQFMEHCHGK